MPILVKRRLYIEPTLACMRLVPLSVSAEYWSHTSVMVSMTTRLFIQIIVHVNDKEQVGGSLLLALCEGNPPTTWRKLQRPALLVRYEWDLTVDSFHKGPGMQIAFPFHQVIICWLIVARLWGCVLDHWVLSLREDEPPITKTRSTLNDAIPSAA